MAANASAAVLRVEFVSIMEGKGSGAVYPDLIARRVTMLFGLAGSASGHIKDGPVKPLAMTGARRANASRYSPA